MTRQRVQRSALVVGLLLAAGCAVLSKGKPLALRYFDLDTSAAYPPATSQTRAQPQPAELRLRLADVKAARHIDRRFVSRRSAHELTYHEQWRFTDQPEAFLQRALVRNLFERAALTRVVSGLAPTLEVELLAFEERAQPDHNAHVAVLAVMHDDRVQLWQKELSVESPVGRGDSAEALATALGSALAQVAARVTEQTLSTLEQAQ